MTFLKKILLVDRESRVTDNVRSALEETGQYVIKEEHDCRLAVSAARWFQPDLILLDLLMSPSHASSALRDLQEDVTSKDTPVVFLKNDSAADGGVLSGGILSGYSFFAAPVRLENVASYVAELLHSARD